MESSSSIPAEIWREIFQLATLNPGALEAFSESHLQMLQWRFNDEGNLNYASNLRIKLALMRVCKMWYAIGAELLFEDCRPRFMSDFRLLVDRLKLKNASGHPRGDGWRVRRLHVPTPPQDSGEGDGHPTILQLLLGAVRMMPNVQILTFGYRLVENMDEDTAGLVQAIVDCLSPNLLYLDHDTYDEMLLFPSVSLPFESFPSLRHYSNLVLAGPNLSRTSMCSNLSHTRITSLTMRVGRPPLIAMIEFLSFPSLRHLTLQHLRRGRIRRLMPFLNKHGPILDSISLEHTLEICGYRVPITDGRFLACCPNLKEIIYLAGIQGSVNDGPYPTVTAIGISAMGPEYGKSLDSNYSFARFPNLQLVRIMNLTYSEPDPDDDSLFGEPVALWSSFRDRGGIRFEDAEGKPVPV